MSDLKDQAPTACRGDRDEGAGERNREEPEKNLFHPEGGLLRGPCMAFFNSAVGVLQTLVIALGAGLGIWGAINLLEGYGNDNRATRS